MSIENIDDLRVLVETARRGTLTAAARVLGVTPAAASARAAWFACCPAGRGSTIR
ncbi:LysR family transcriptional regulator [Sorangium cellulosum]|uniref:LysR family transcriptional regulator n=1 Tax=Sorangium TaxID=39643 RepID=UPI0012DB3EAE|nr:LysR family transcriptional regulator [Sorangium cellulosum]